MKQFGFITLAASCLALPSPTEAQAVPDTVTLQHLTELRDRLDDAGARLEAVEKSQLETAAQLRQLDRVALFLGVIVAIGALASLFGFVRTEIRATEAHKYALTTSREAETRSLQAFDLAVRGETASQARAAEVHEQFLSGSRKTLDLVNATLELAKEASERAARSQEERLAESLAILDGDAQDLLSHVRGIDDRTLLRDQTLLEQLTTLSEGLNNYEASRLYLPRVPKLTAPCQFARGMQFHVNQQFNDAMTCWRNIVHDREAETRYRAFALYWIGYEQQSLGNFADAANNYANAEALVDTISRLELKRLSLEMQFFASEDQELSSIIGGLTDLLVALDAHSEPGEVTHRVSRTRLTLGNVLHVHALQLRTAGATDAAAAVFQQAVEQFRASETQEQYSRFGLAEGLYESGDQAEAAELYRTRIREDMSQEALRRPEPRSKVLALSMELFACMRVPEWNDEVPLLLRDTITELGKVNERLWVYSAIRRRPVAKRDFRSELEAYVESWDRARARVTPTLGSRPQRQRR